MVMAHGVPSLYKMRNWSVYRHLWLFRLLSVFLAILVVIWNVMRELRFRQGI